MKADVTIANSGFSTKADLSQPCLTTLNWFQMKPVYFKEVLPGEDIDIDINGTMQMLALNKPMFSNIRCLVRSFFVPYRVIFPHWNAFITDSREKNRKFSQVPSMPVIDFLRKFITDSTLITKTKVQLLTPLASYDFIVRDLDEDMFPDLQSNEAYGCVFTKKGRRIYDILVGLGYNFNFGYTYEPNSLNQDWRSVNFGNVSLLSLMAYAKIVCDWFTLPAYQDKINTIGAILDTIAQEPDSDTIISQVFLLLEYCLDLHYSDDIFVSAWDNPTTPTAGTTANSQITFEDITNQNQTQGQKASVTNGSSPYGTMNGTPFMYRADGGNAAIQHITQYVLNALQKFSSFMRRNQIVGFRPLDRYLARYGKKLSSEQLLRSIVLDESKFNVEINPVLSQSDTVGIAANQAYGSQLGDKAGQGFGTINGHIHFKSQDEFGIIISVCYIIPIVKYYQGLNPANTRISLTDFYQPEFDGLGCEAIPAKSLFSASMNSFIPKVDDPNYNTLVEDSQYPQTQAFGFAPRYYTYKTNPYAIVSGDFRFNSRNAGMEQWHLFRKIRSSSTQPDVINLGIYDYN